MYPFFHDSFNKHRLSTISDQIYEPPPISLASAISWALGLLVTESSGYNGTGIFMAAAAVTHFSVTPTFSVSPSECWALVPLLLWYLQWQPLRSGTPAWPNQICTDSSSSYPTVTQMKHHNTGHAIQLPCDCAGVVTQEVGWLTVHRRTLINDRKKTGYTFLFLPSSNSEAQWLCLVHLAHPSWLRNWLCVLQTCSELDNGELWLWSYICFSSFHISFLFLSVLLSWDGPSK